MPDSRRILIVEDEEGIALHLTFLLKRLNFTPLEAIAFGEQAVDRAGELKPDLVLMDIGLAGQMDGIEAAGLIGAKYHLPVIFLSALDEELTIHKAQGSDPYGYLTKPVKEADLRAAIEVALYKHSMEARLRDSEERYRLLFERMTNGFVLMALICDEAGCPVDFRILTVNPAFTQMSGMAPGILEGHTLREVSPGYPYLDQMLDRLGHVALTGQSMTFEAALTGVGIELSVTAYLPSAGHVACIAEDVTERRRAERSLKESETRFRQLAENVREVFWLRQREGGQMLYISPSYERVFGRSCDEIYRDPRAFAAGIHPEDLAVVRQSMVDLQEKCIPFDQEYRIILPDGTQRWIWARAFPVAEETGEVTRFSGIAEDVTERRQAEDALRDSYHQIEQSLRRLTVLRNIDQTITTQVELSSMASSVLGHLADQIEIDAAALFVPNLPAPGRLRGTGPLSQLRLAGLAGLPESVLDSTVLNWEMLAANDVFLNGQSVYLPDLRHEDHPGAQSLARLTGLTGCAILPLAARGQVKGVLQCFRRQPAQQDEGWQSFLQSLALQTAIAMDNVEMFEQLKRSNRDLTLAYEETIKGWAEALEMRHSETLGHSRRVTELALLLAGPMGLHGEMLEHFRRGVLLHDIGKMAIPDNILTKAGKLSDEDWIIMRQHPTFGFRMLQGIEYLRPALDVVYYHHERWDGTGYPRRLKGEEIPLVARVFAIVDVWDALTQDRLYRPAWPKEEALRYITEQSQKHFDPRVVAEFVKVIALLGC